MKKSKQKENNKCTLYGVGLSVFRPDIENWGLGTYIYIYIYIYIYMPMCFIGVLLLD